MPVPKYLKLSGNKKIEGSAVNISTGVAEADSIVATGADGKIDESLLPPGVGDEKNIKTASEALAALDFVNVFDDAGTEKIRKADASAFSTRANGYVTDNYNLGDLAAFYGEGTISGFTGLTIGAPVFLDDVTPGGITQTPPTATGAIWQQIGVAISATEIRVEIGEAIERA
jgi:hypothetical protein